MDGKKSTLVLSTAEQYHRGLMLNVLSMLTGTPLVLKGGTALSLFYGLPRFSEDLDFDAPFYLRLESKLRKCSTPNTIINDVVEVVHKNHRVHSGFDIRYGIRGSDFKRPLEVQVSHRISIPPSEVCLFGPEKIKVASPRWIIAGKLSAAHDNNNPRTKLRDLFDLYFLAANYPSDFSRDNILSLKKFAGNPDDLFGRYKHGCADDNLVKKFMDQQNLSLEDLALNMSVAADNLYRRLSSNPERRVVGNQ